MLAKRAKEEGNMDACALANLVVTVASVARDVQQDVLAKLLSVLNREPEEGKRKLLHVIKKLAPPQTQGTDGGEGGGVT